MKHALTKAERDKSVIVSILRRFGPLSRVGIHELTHLRRSTISQLVRELINEGHLVEAGPSNNPLGRKQILLRINEQTRFVVGVDFDAEFVTAAVMDLAPHVQNLVKEPSILTDDTEGLVKQLIACARRAIDESDVPRESLLGIGIGDPGLVNAKDGISVMCSTIKFWREVPTRKMFEDAFGVPALLGSNTRIRTLAERTFGAADVPEDMVYVEYSRGIGAGIVIGGKILEGHRWSAGEFGHTRITESGPPCKCGSFGCLEAMVGAAAVEARIRGIVQAGGTSQALSLAGGDPEKMTAWTVLEAARLGDKSCGAIVEELGRYLGLGLSNLVNLFNPALIVLDKRLELAGPSLLEHVVRTVKLQSLDYSNEDLAFRYGSLGDEAGILGAGLLVLERLFEIPALRPPSFMIETNELPALSPRVQRAHG